MRTKDEISKMDPIDAYNLAVNDCAKSATLKCTGDPKTMSFHNSSPRDIQFFDVDPQSINKNLIIKDVASA